MTGVSTFVYVTFIRTTQDRLWSALVSPEFMKQYWFGMHIETDWEPGSAWQLVFQMFSEPEEASPMPVSEDLRYTDSYARAIQALRDVRHLLPREGVAIVDRVLDCAT